MRNCDIPSAPCFVLGILCGPGGSDSVVLRGKPAPLRRSTRRKLAGRTQQLFLKRRRTISTTWTMACPCPAEEVQGRNMWLVWTGGNDRFWDKVTKDSLATFDLLKIVTSHPSQAYCDGKHCDRDSRWHWLGAINEPCFEKPTAPDPQRFGLWLDVRGARTVCRIRSRTRKLSRREDRRARNNILRRLETAGRLLFRLRNRHRRLAAVSQPGFRPGSKGQMGSREVLHRPELLQRSQARSALSRRHGVRILPCRPEPNSPAGRPGSIRNGPISTRPSAANIFGWTVFSSTPPTQELPLSADAFLSARHDGHLAGLDRLHQQSAHDERGLSAGPRLAEAQLWGKETLKGAELNNRQLPRHL